MFTMMEPTLSKKKDDLKVEIARKDRVAELNTKRVSKKTVFFSRVKRKALRHLWLVRAGLLAAILISVYLLATLFGTVINKTSAGFYYGLAKDFIFTPSGKVETISGRTNVLILGKGGKGHEAPDLTDTIIFASISHQEPSITLISLPRDIWIPELRAKLNSTYYWGNQKQPLVQRTSGSEDLGGGLILSKSTIEQIVGTHVHYVVVVDFSGFKNIIDTLGGIEVEVENSFIDKKYPIPGRESDDCGGNDPEFLCRYQTVEFEKGKQIMDGETALKFARSRNAEGDEGTDFARAKRQQEVIAGIRDKILSKQVLMNPGKIIQIIGVVQDSIETDMSPSVQAILARRVFDSRDKVTSLVLPEELLVNPPESPRYDNLYVFIPKEDGPVEPGHEWDKIHDWVACILENRGCEQ